MAAPKKKGLSLYADLLPPASTISGAPVKYGSEAAVAEDADQPVKKPKDASLQFHPTHRPQAQLKANKSKPAFPPSSVPLSSHAINSSSTNPEDSAQPVNSGSLNKQATVPGGNVPRLGQKRYGYDDWMADEEEEAFFSNQPRPSRKNKKKKHNHNQQQTRVWRWTDPYDISTPTSIVDYKTSDERYEKMAAWKAHLYAANVQWRKKHGKDVNKATDSGDEPRNGMSLHNRPMQFAPPASLNFAPPSLYHKDDGPHAQPDTLSEPSQQSPPGPAPQFSREESGEDAYARRMRLGAAQEERVQPLPAPPVQAQPLAPLAPTAQNADPAAHSAKPLTPQHAEVLKKLAAAKAKIQASLSRAQAASPSATSVASDVAVAQPPPPPPSPPPAASQLPPPPPFDDQPTGTISRAPVRYESTDAVPDANIDMQTDDNVGASQGQYVSKEGFARRYMEKLGWDKSKGLGADGQGITSAIKVVPEKRKKRSDAEGGGFVKPAAMGRIVGGKKRNAAGEDELGSAVSHVVKIEGMLDGLDVEYEIEHNSLQQEIGDAMTDNYGMNERMFIWSKDKGGNNEVFVKFTSMASAMKAVNEADCMEFANNVNIKASFWDEDKFESGEYA